MSERIRRLADTFQEKLKLLKVITQVGGREATKKAEELIAQKNITIPQVFPKDSIYRKVKNVVSRYEKFTGVEEIMALQNTVVTAQENFMSAQEKRRELGRKLAELESRLKELHAEMQNTMKGDDKYLKLCTEEHNLIIQERALRSDFNEAERDERELFAAMSSAVKAGHERERAHAERNKYWYIVASIFGTVLGIGGSTVNNHIKMSEFRELMEQQMTRNLIHNAGGAGFAAVNPADRDLIQSALRNENAKQEELLDNVKSLHETVRYVVQHQNSLIDTIKNQEKELNNKFRDIKRLIIAASQTSLDSEEKMTKLLSEYHHDMDAVPAAEPLARVDPGDIVHYIGITVFALALGYVFGKVI